MIEKLLIGKFEFIGMLDDIEREIKVQDQVHARAKADEFISLWMETKPKYEALCEHDEVDKIQACVEQFSVLLDQRNPLVFTQTALLKYYYSHITDIDSFAFENIF